MSSELKSSLAQPLAAAAANAGLALVSATEGSDFHGQPTHVFELGLDGGAGCRLRLELSSAFDFDKPHLLPEMTSHLAAEAKRLRNPRPDCYVTLGGLPISFGNFIALLQAPTRTSCMARCTWPTEARTTCT
jgi:hypothetical protein